MRRVQEFLNAARTGDQETFLNILNDNSININPNHADERGNTALILATGTGQAAIVNMLLADERIDPNHANEQGFTALIWAAFHGHIDIVRALLADRCVEPGYANHRGETALMWAARRSHRNILCALLADERVDPNHANERGNTALIWAAGMGQAAIINMLLADESIDPNHADEDGNTALIWAAERGHSDIVDILFAHIRIDLSHADQAKKAIIAATKFEHDKTLGLLLKSTGQRLSDDEIANLTERKQNFYKRILTRLFRRARFRGIVRAIMVFRRMRLRAAEAVYAPDGTGYAVAADSFATAASQQSSSTGTLTSTETNDITAGITQSTDEPGEPLTKK